MTLFGKEYFFVLFVLSLYSLIGGFSLISFRNHIKYPVLAAPFAGMLLWSLGVYILYSLAGLSVQNAMLTIGISGMITTVASLIYIKPKLYHPNAIIPGIFILLFSAFIVFLINFTSIHYGAIGLLYMEGSDHLGYAQMADWLNTYRINQPPVTNPMVPYQSFLSILMGRDPLLPGGDARFGSFFTLAIISRLFNESGTFSYDIACSIVLLASYFGIAAIYSRRFTIMVCIVLALLVNFWFIECKTGYFGKMLGFPAIFYILGLYFVLQNSFNENPFAFFSLLILNFAAAILYPGQVLAGLLISVGGVFLILKLMDLGWNFTRGKLIQLQANATVLIIMILSVIATSGFLSVPKGITYNTDIPLDWVTILLHQLDIRYLVHDAFLNWYTSSLALFFLYGFLVMTIIAFCLVLGSYNLIAVSFISAAMILIIFPLLNMSKWFAYEFSGIIYTLILCGFAWSIGTATNKITCYSMVCLLGVALIIRLPTFAETVHHYAGTGILIPMQYSKNEIDHLVDSIDHQRVIIDAPNVMFALPVLVELGRRNVDLQWTDASWKAILGYRDWVPGKIQPTQLILGLTADAMHIIGLKIKKRDHCAILAKTRQYQLFKCQDPIRTANMPLTYYQV